MIDEERLRNTRAWAAARVGQLSGAEVIVGAIDELLQRRSDGYVLVPREPTEDVLKAIWFSLPICHDGFEDMKEDCEKIYRIATGEQPTQEPTE